MSTKSRVSISLNNDTIIAFNKIELGIKTDVNGNIIHVELELMDNH